MKKSFALLLALVLCLSIGTAAFADADPGFGLTYTLMGGTEVPAENAAFTVTASADNPDTKMITLDAPVAAAAETKVGIQFPVFETPGLYLYTISQTAGTSQGVIYDTDSMVFQILFGYDENGALSVIGSGAGSNGSEKKEGFTNSYQTGSLELTAVTDGTAPDKNKNFTVTVTLTAESGKEVAGTVRCTDDGETTAENPGWTEKNFTVTLKDGETVTLSGIPAGMSYTVSQTAEAGYTGSITPNSGTVGLETAKVTVTNTDGTTLPTGVSLDSLPYVILLAAVISGFFFLLLRRRKEEDEE